MSKPTSKRSITKQPRKVKRVSSERIKVELCKYKTILPTSLFDEASRFLKDHPRLSERELTKFVSDQLEQQNLGLVVEFLVNQRVQSIVNKFFHHKS